MAAALIPDGVWDLIALLLPPATPKTEGRKTSVI